MIVLLMALLAATVVTGMIVYGGEHQGGLSLGPGEHPMFHGATSHEEGDQGHHEHGHESTGPALDLVLELNGEWHAEQVTNASVTQIRAAPRFSFHPDFAYLKTSGRVSCLSVSQSLMTLMASSPSPIGAFWPGPLGVSSPCSRSAFVLRSFCSHSSAA